MTASLSMMWLTRKCTSSIESTSTFEFPSLVENFWPVVMKLDVLTSTSIRDMVYKLMTVNEYQPFASTGYEPGYVFENPLIERLPNLNAT